MVANLTRSCRWMIKRKWQLRPLHLALIALQLCVGWIVVFIVVFVLLVLGCQWLVVRSRWSCGLIGRQSSYSRFPFCCKWLINNGTARRNRENWCRNGSQMVPKFVGG